MPDNKINRGNSLVSHPFRSWYDEQIMSGLSTNQIYNRQTEGKIPQEMHVGVRTISEYRNNILKLNTEVVKQFKEEKEKAEIEEIHQEIINEPEMQVVIAEKAAMLIDADNTFFEMHSRINEQIRKLATIDDPKTRAKIDVAATIGTLCDQLRLVTTDFLKIQGKLRDTPQNQVININIEQNNAEMLALQTVIKDIINEIDPSALPRFFDLLKQRVDPLIQTFNLKRQNISISTNEQNASRAVQEMILHAPHIKS